MGETNDAELFFQFYHFSECLLFRLWIFQQLTNIEVIIQKGMDLQDEQIAFTMNFQVFLAIQTKQRDRRVDPIPGIAKHSIVLSDIRQDRVIWILLVNELDNSYLVPNGRWC